MGLDTGLGAHRATVVQITRLSKAAKRCSKLVVRRQVGNMASSLYMPPIRPLANYAQNAMGLAPTGVKSLRTCCATAALPKAG